jgi:hypothetical protein
MGEAHFEKRSETVSEVPFSILESGASAMSNITHGMKHTAEWNAWRSIRKRCFDPNNIGYKMYGGAGITMCAAWKTSFLQFFADMGHRV